MAIVTTPAGTEVGRAEGQPVPDQAARAGGWGFTFELSLADVPPGSYVLTVEGPRRPPRSCASRAVSSPGLSDVED